MVRMGKVYLLRSPVTSRRDRSRLLGPDPPVPALGIRHANHRHLPTPNIRPPALSQNLGGDSFPFLLTIVLLKRRIPGKNGEGTPRAKLPGEFRLEGTP